MTKITYRPMRPTDVDDLHGVVSHWETARMLGGWPWPANKEFTAGRCKPYTGNGFVWAICIEDRLIGNVAVTNGELGYMLHHDYHRQGIMRRSVVRALDKAFSDGADLVQAGTWDDNPASQRLLESLGFFHWHTNYDRTRARKAPVLGRWYRLSKADWMLRNG